MPSSKWTSFAPEEVHPLQAQPATVVVLLENIYLLRQQCVYLTDNRTITFVSTGKQSLSDVDWSGEIVTVRRYDDTSFHDHTYLHPAR